MECCSEAQSLSNYNLRVELDAQRGVALEQHVVEGQNDSTAALSQSWQRVLHHLHGLRSESFHFLVCVKKISKG